MPNKKQTAKTAQKVVDACAAWIQNVDTNRLKEILKMEINNGIDTLSSSPDDTAMLHQTIILIEDLENTDDLINAKTIDLQDYEQN